MSPVGPGLAIRAAAVAMTFGAVAAQSAADAGQELLSAASRGETANVQALLRKGANPEAKDKNGRTSLMLAAQHGHAGTVRALLAAGASAGARDSHGDTAYTLALLSPASPPEAVEDVLRALPHPAPPRLVVDAAWSGENLYNSCLMRPGALRQLVAGIQLDGDMVAELREFIQASGRSLVEIQRTPAHGTDTALGDDAFRGADAVLVLRLRPSAACMAQTSADRLDLAIDAQLWRSRDRGILLNQTFGGKLKGLHGREVTGIAQYAPTYREWVKAHAKEIYWAAVETWLRAGP